MILRYKYRISLRNECTHITIEPPTLLRFYGKKSAINKQVNTVDAGPTAFKQKCNQAVKHERVAFSKFQTVTFVPDRPHFLWCLTPQQYRRQLISVLLKQNFKKNLSYSRPQENTRTKLPATIN